MQKSRELYFATVMWTETINWVHILLYTGVLICS